jgi:hypothetical protein
MTYQKGAEFQPEADHTLVNEINPFIVFVLKGDTPFVALNGEVVGPVGIPPL